MNAFLYSPDFFGRLGDTVLLHNHLLRELGVIQRSSYHRSQHCPEADSFSAMSYLGGQRKPLAGSLWNMSGLWPQLCYIKPMCICVHVHGWLVGLSYEMVAQTKLEDLLWDVWETGLIGKGRPTWLTSIPKHRPAEGFGHVIRNGDLVVIRGQTAYAGTRPETFSLVNMCRMCQTVERLGTGTSARRQKGPGSG